jgi:hypothetical protein
MLTFRPPSQILPDLGAKNSIQNLSLRGFVVPRIHVDGNIVRDPTALARVIMSITGTLRDTATTALANPFASSILISNLTSWSGDRVVNHYLGRPYTGWTVMRPRGGVPVVYENTSQAGLNASKQISLHSTTAGLVFDLLFY